MLDSDKPTPEDYCHGCKNVSSEFSAQDCQTMRRDLDEGRVNFTPKPDNRLCGSDIADFVLHNTEIT